MTPTMIFDKLGKCSWSPKDILRVKKESVRFGVRQLIRSVFVGEKLSQVPGLTKSLLFCTQAIEFGFH